MLETPQSRKTSSPLEIGAVVVTLQQSYFNSTAHFECLLWLKSYSLGTKAPTSDLESYLSTQQAFLDCTTATYFKMSSKVIAQMMVLCLLMSSWSNGSTYLLAIRDPLDLVAAGGSGQMAFGGDSSLVLSVKNYDIYWQARRQLFFFSLILLTSSLFLRRLRSSSGQQIKLLQVSGIQERQFLISWLMLFSYFQQWEQARKQENSTILCVILFMSLSRSGCSVSIEQVMKRDL